MPREHQGSPFTSQGRLASGFALIVKVKVRRAWPSILLSLFLLSGDPVTHSRISAVLLGHLKQICPINVYQVL